MENITAWSFNGQPPVSLREISLLQFLKSAESLNLAQISLMEKNQSIQTDYNANS